MKKPWLAFLIASILPGMGHFYLGKFERGLLILISRWVLFIVIVTTGIYDGLNLNMGEFYLLAYMNRFLLSWITNIIVYIWQAYDAYKLAKESSIKQ